MSLCNDMRTLGGEVRGRDYGGWRSGEAGILNTGTETILTGDSRAHAGGVRSINPTDHHAGEKHEPQWPEAPATKMYRKLFAAVALTLVSFT